MLVIPEMLNTPEFTDAETSYEWTHKTYLYFGMEVENVKLQNLFEKLHYKAVVGFGAAIGEWVFWRLENVLSNKMGIDLTPYLNAVTTLQAAAISSQYTTDWDLEEELDHYKFEHLRSPNARNIAAILLTSSFLTGLNKRYKKGKRLIWTDMDKLAMLARHISPDKTLFDNWLQDRLEKAIKLFPIDYSTFSLADENAIYNTSIDSPVPREFFFTPDFDYQRANVPQLLNQFLQGLNYQDNPYLNSPDKMLEEGFDGTPYHYGHN